MSLCDNCCTACAYCVAAWPEINGYVSLHIIIIIENAIIDDIGRPVYTTTVCSTDRDDATPWHTHLMDKRSVIYVYV